MHRRALIFPFFLVLGTLPTVSPAAAEAEPDFIAVTPRGVAPVVMDGSTFVFTVDLFSLTTAEKVGTATDHATCAMTSPPPCSVYDVTTTYRVSGSEVTSRGLWSVAPDPSRPGFAFVGTRPTTDTILSGTGRFAGRTGRVTGWGSDDLREFPSKIGIDEFVVIRFSPKDDKVLGSRELFAGDGPSKVFPAQFAWSNGVDESTDDPTHFNFTTEVLSLSDGSHRADVKDDITCGAGPPPCLVLDVITHLTYADGEVTAHSQVPLSPDPQRPGWYLFATRPTADNIVSGTGAYAGRTGRFMVNGTVDMTHFPDPLPFEALTRLAFN